MLSLTVFGRQNALVDAVESFLVNQFDGVTLRPSDEPVDGSVVVAMEGLDEYSRSVDLPDFPQGAPSRPTLYLINPEYESFVPRHGKDWVAQFDPDASVAAITAQETVERWLNETFSRGDGESQRRSTADGQARAAIENLTGYIATILDNGYLKRLVAELDVELKATREELTAAQIEARSFKALYDQLRLDNEALKHEQWKRNVDRQGASVRTRLLRVGWATLFASGFLGNFLANEVDHVRHDADAEELQQAVTQIPKECNQTIIILNRASSPNNSSDTDSDRPARMVDPETGESRELDEHDPIQKWPDDHTETTWPVEDAQSFTLGESTLDGPQGLG